MLAVGDEVVTYEDVVRMEPQVHWKRPVILIGTCRISHVRQHTLLHCIRSITEYGTLNGAVYAVQY